MAEARANQAGLRKSENRLRQSSRNPQTSSIARFAASTRSLDALYKAVPHRRAATRSRLSFQIARGTTRSLRFFADTTRSRRHGHDAVKTQSRQGHDRVTTRHDAVATRFVVTTRSRQGHDAVTTRSRRGHGHDEVTTRSRRVLWSRQGHDAVTTWSSETQSPHSCEHGFSDFIHESARKINK